MKNIINIIEIVLYLVFAANLFLFDVHTILYIFIANFLILLIISFVNLVELKYKPDLLSQFTPKDKKLFNIINFSSLFLFIALIILLLILNFDESEYRIYILFPLLNILMHGFMQYKVYMSRGHSTNPI